MWSILVILLVAFYGIDVRADIAPEAVFNHTGTESLVSSRPDSCNICHGAAGREITSQTDQLCYQCHSSIEEKARKTYRHSDIINRRYPSIACEGCHKLHKAGAQPLLVQNELELCYSCHSETREHNSHPVMSYSGGNGSYEIKGSDGRPITCASHCHDTHGTDYKYLCRLEPGRELCIACHKDF